MSDPSTDEIELAIMADRAALDRTIEELIDRTTPNAVVSQAGAYLAANGQPIAEALLNRVREKPVAAALAGVGLAWLAFGKTKRQQSLLSRYL